MYVNELIYLHPPHIAHSSPLPTDLPPAPVDANPGAPPISLSQDTPFQKDLANAAKSTTPADSLGTVARAFIAGKSFIGQPDASPFQVKLLALGMSLDTLQQPGTLFLQDIVDAVKKAFGKDVGKVVTGDDFQALLKGLIDSVVAIKFVPVSTLFTVIEICCSHLRVS